MTVSGLFLNGRIKVTFPDGSWKSLPRLTASGSRISATGLSGSNSPSSPPHEVTLTRGV